MEGLHKLSSAFVFAFILLHMINHVVGLQSIEAHLTFMAVARMVYQNPIVEMGLFLAFVIQMITGWALAQDIWSKKKDFVHQLQAASGVYITFFVLSHVAFIMIGRLWLKMDTNIYYAIAGLMSAPWMYVLIPYYALGIMSLFVHAGCIAYDIFKKTYIPAAWFLLVLTVGVGGYVTYLMMMTYSGRVFPIEIPIEYIELYGGQMPKGS
jgi:hypothetical protein